MELKKKLHFISSDKDKRTIIMSKILPRFSVPKQVDYTDKMTPVRNQGNAATGVVFAAIAMKEYQEKKERSEWNWKILSPRYLFEECNKIDSFPTCTGTSILTVLKVLANKGVCEEIFWPYVGCDPCTPNCDIGVQKEGADQNAQQYKIKAYAMLDDYDTMKRSLIANGPFIIGVPIYENWMNQEVHTTGKIPMPANEGQMGGISLCVVGYNDETQMFKFKNSWGTGWGDKGYGYLPYPYMNHQFSEAWGMTDYIEDPRSLIRMKEEILNKLDQSFKE